MLLISLLFGVESPDFTEMENKSGRAASATWFPNTTTPIALDIDISKCRNLNFHYFFLSISSTGFHETRSERFVLPPQSTPETSVTQKNPKLFPSFKRTKNGFPAFQWTADNSKFRSYLTVKALQKVFVSGPFVHSYIRAHGDVVGHL